MIQHNAYICASPLMSSLVPLQITYLALVIFNDNDQGHAQTHVAGDLDLNWITTKRFISIEFDPKLINIVSLESALKWSVIRKEPAPRTPSSLEGCAYNPNTSKSFQFADFCHVTYKP